jgi:HEAT repeat protein
LNYSKGRIMNTKLAALIMLLAVFVASAVADDVNKWIQNLKNPSPAVRETAALALMELNDTRSVEPMIQALKDNDSNIRWMAARSLGIAKDRRAVNPLILALRDNNSDVLFWAANALISIGEPAVEPLILALGRSKPSLCSQ